MTKTPKLLKSRTVEKKTKEETTMAEIYKNIKTGAKAELVEINEKSKQVTLKKLADGKPTSTLLGSFEKYWKKIDGDAAVEKKSAKTEPKKAEKPVEDVKKAKKEKSKKEKKPKKEKVAGKSSDERIAIRDDFVKQLADAGIKANIPVNYPMWIDIKIGEKNAFGVGMNQTSVRVRSIKELIPDTMEYHDVKGALNVGLNLDYARISELVEVIVNAEKNFKDSDILKRKKTGKEKKSEQSEKKETKKSKKVETEEK